MADQGGRPNVVFFFADDWGRYASAYRKFQGDNTVNQIVNTPNFDRIAAEGAIFTNAHVPVPSCTPCRSSILSGTYFWETGLGAILEGARWDESIPTYPLMLEDKGYHIGYTYKVWSPGKTENAPYGGQRTRYEPSGNKWREFSQEVTKRVPELGVKGAKEVLFDEVRSNFLAFMDDVPDGDPFCYWFGPVNTHRAWERGSGKALWDMDPDDLKGKMPDFLPDVHDIREDFNDYLGEVQAVDAGVGIILEELEKAGELDNTLIVISGDHGIPGFPRSKCNLYDIGSQVTLAARWPGKIEAGKVIDEFVNLMSLAPTFLEAAGEKPNANMTHSILPLMTSTPVDPPESNYEYVVTGRERHVAFSREGALPYPSRGIRTKDFLYIYNFAPDRWPMGDPYALADETIVDPGEVTRRAAYRTLASVRTTTPVYGDWDGGPTKDWMLVNRTTPEYKPKFELAFGKRPARELYDLRSDPDYMLNVAEHQEYSDTVADLHETLLNVLHRYNDPRVTQVDCEFDKSPYAGPVYSEWYDGVHNDAVWQEPVDEPDSRYLG